MSLTEKKLSDTYLRCSKFPTDPETRLEVFKKHWKCTVKTMSKDYLTLDESEPVIYYMEQMVSLMIEEKSTDIQGISGFIFEYSMQQDIFNKIYELSSKFMGEPLERLKHQQLRLFSVIVSQSHPSVLCCKEILQPLLKLINGYSLRSSFKLERSLVHLLQLICVRVSNEPDLQSLCTDIGATVLNDPLPLLNPLVPFLHRDGTLGQDAKDAVLLLVALSHNNEDIAISVALQSDFCPVLATGLSALYSALPRKLPAYCHSILLGQINDGVVEKYTQVQHFLHYLRFCCQVNEIAHPLVREAVLHYVYNGFLLPVIGSSFNQNSLDEVITATIYFDLFLRTITDSSLLKAFLCFIIAESYDGFRLLDSLLNRLNSNTGLGVATLSLVNTMISFRCEDVMFELLFRHLIPCRHIASSPESTQICDRENIKDSFTLFLELSSNPSLDRKEIEPGILDAANKSLNCCNHACESSWQFDYDGVNPSPDYLEKIIDPSQLQKPFHGFLDHYSQLLEMRDNCKKGIGYSPAVSRRSNSTSTYFDMNGSCNFTPRSQISRSNSYDTLTSLKFENDSQLDLCLQRLRYPSAEDLLEQKSHYVLNYNILDQMTDDESLIGSPFVSKKAAKEQAAKKFRRSFDLARAISGDSVDSPPPDSGISMDDLDQLANSGEIESFKASLDRIPISQWWLRNCVFSLDEVMSSILDEDKADQDKPMSPACSQISLQSALTIEDNILSQNDPRSNYPRSTAVGSNNFVSVGLFLNTVLERLEKFDRNPFQINLQLTAIVTSLLSFPQPLIRNYLLNPREQFVGGIKCLYKILNVVKSRIDEARIKINATKKDDQYFKRMCLEARSRLDQRVDMLVKGDVESEEQIRICGQLQTTESNVTIIKMNKAEKRHFNLLEFISRKTSANEDGPGNGWSSGKGGRRTKEETEYYTHLNLAFASVLFEELCKEIAAFAKEHYVFRR